jgi:hypothetical protein
MGGFCECRDAPLSAAVNNTDPPGCEAAVAADQAGGPVSAASATTEITINLLVCLDSITVHLPEKLRKPCGSRI